MGGINSGRRRSVNRGAVEQFPCIDLRILRRAGLLLHRECTYDTLYWRNQVLGGLSAQIFIDLSNVNAASIKIIVRNAEFAINERVAMDCVPCNLGGVRCYFLCPINGHRCEQLFLVDGIFASRKAHSLIYAAQSEDELSRSRRKVRKLHRQVEGSARYGRPRGNNRWSMMKRLRAAEYDAHMLYREKLHDLVG